MLGRKPRTQEYLAVERYGFSREIVEAALLDIENMEKLICDLLDCGPTLVCWCCVDRHAPSYEMYGEPRIVGFSSLDTAVQCFLWRVQGLRTALTTNTDGLLDPHDREHRDRIVTDFLNKIREKYIDAPKQ